MYSLHFSFVIIMSIALSFAVMDFQCLATWENGDKYLYGSFSQPWMTSVDDYQYRCFVSVLLSIIT